MCCYGTKTGRRKALHVYEDYQSPRVYRMCASLLAFNLTLIDHSLYNRNPFRKEQRDYDVFLYLKLVTCQDLCIPQPKQISVCAIYSGLFWV